MAGSAKYEVLVRHTADLQLAVRENLTSLGAELVSAQIITLDQYKEIRNAHRPVNERGADLVAHVQNKVRQDPRHYQAFLRVLRKDLSQYGDILTKLEQAQALELQPLNPQFPLPREDDNPLPAQETTMTDYDAKECEETTTTDCDPKEFQSEETTMTDCDAKESEGDIRFHCPCGECSVETYLQDGCPKSHIPYLGMNTLSKEDRENLNYVLKKDTKRIMECFTDLSNRTCDSLKRQGVTVDNLVRVAISSNPSLRDKLIRSTSVDQVFSHLFPEMSFFNHETLAKIINELGDIDDKDRLADYSKEFKEFCQRKVFEVEPGHRICGQRLSRLKGRKLFAVVLPKDKEMIQNLEDAVNIKEMLAEVLDVPPATLHLHRIDQGSVILVFSVPDSIAEELFPLPKGKLSLLRAKGMVLFVPQDLKLESNLVEDTTACSADMHEPSSEQTPTVSSVTPGDLLISHSLPTSAQLSWTPAPDDETITGYTVQGEGPKSTQETPMDGNATSYETSDFFSVSAMTEAGTGPPLSVSSTTPTNDDTKCPVCLNVHVDPCTLSCGHTFCQLCLAHMWKSSNKHCPVCKETWKVLPSISFDYRRNTESAHGHEVERLRKEYSHEDRELIEKFLEAKRESTLPSEDLAQELEEKPPLCGIWKLPGVEECGETSVVVHSSQGQLVEWNGLKLHIHAGSLPENLQQCTIFIKASLAGEYKIPENTSLVSAIFWLRCEPQCTFIKPVTVEIQHCSTQRDLSKLKIVRALCSQKSLPYKFKLLKGGSFNADTFYGAIDMKGFSGAGVVDENPNSERMHYSQLFYGSYHSHQQSHEIHITFVWNDEAHINDISRKYPEDSFFAGCHRVIEIEGKEIEVALDTKNWTKVMDGQWEILPTQPTVTKAELDDFKPGRGIPNCVLKARPLCEDFPELLHQVILNGIKPPHHKVLLSYRSDRDYPSGASVQQPQSPPTVQMPSSERLPLQQQSPRSSVATPRTTQHQLNSDTGGQQTKIDNLKITDLKDVKSALWDARAKWRNIGSCIGVDEGTLDTMKGKDPGESLRDVMSHWLRGVHNPKEKNSKPRTWHTLIEALRDKTVNEEAMADKLEKEKYPDTNQDKHSTPPESDVPSATQKLMLSSSMSDEDSKGVNDDDCKTLSENGVTAAESHLCDTKDFDNIELSKLGKKQSLEAFAEVKGQHSDQQPSEDDHSIVQVDRRDERKLKCCCSVH